MALLKTQGSTLYIVNGSEVLKMSEITAIDFGSDSTNKIDVTSIEDTETKRYLSGLSDPSEATFSLNLDPAKAEHKKLLDLAKAKTDGLAFVLGFKDGTADVTGTATALNFPTTRSYAHFSGSLGSASVKVETDSVVKVDVTVTRSSAVNLRFKTT